MGPRVRGSGRCRVSVGSLWNWESAVYALVVFLAVLYDLSKISFPNYFERVERVNRQDLMPSGLVHNGEMERSGADVAEYY